MDAERYHPSGMVKLIIVAAVDLEGGIGLKNGIPWNIPEDLAHFKGLTSQPDSAVLMGSKTWDSIPPSKSTGEKLPGRLKIVLSRRVRTPLKNTCFFDKMSTYAIRILAGNLGLKTVFVVGGAKVYTHLMEGCDEAIITRVNQRYETDVKFPTDLLRRYGFVTRIAENAFPNCDLEYYSINRNGVVTPGQPDPFNLWEQYLAEPWGPRPRRDFMDPTPRATPEITREYTRQNLRVVPDTARRTITVQYDPLDFATRNPDRRVP